MNKHTHRLLYLFFDFTTAAIAWTVFFIFRKFYIDKFQPSESLLQSLDSNYFTGLLFVPFFWVILYALQGYYKNIYRKSRLYEFFQTIIIIIIGTIILFFTLMLDDFVVSYEKYYLSISYYLILQFGITYIPRVIITTTTNKKILNRKIGFNTILIGSNEKALSLYNRLTQKQHSSGNKFVGFINIYEREEFLLSSFIPHLGSIDHIPDIIRKYSIEEVIIAVESKEHSEIEKIINKLEGFSIVIKAIPDNTDIISGKVKISSLFDEPLIQISHDLMPAWQESLKRIIDISVSIFVLVVFSPLFLIVAVAVKLSSPGPIIYSHQRIGRNGKPFTIYKFRSMYVGSESKGPELAQENDKRVTPLGAFLRKVRLDEIPQFYNVLIGDMSLVGPRPEREYFIKQITEVAPHYAHLHKVRPGITSWGQVKYGYAKNVDEMVERLKYDIIYIENMSIYIDIKIIIYTIKTVFLGKGL